MHKALVESGKAVSAGDWRLLFLRNERLQQLSAEAIRKTAGAYFRRDARNVGMLIPDTEPRRATIPVAPSAAELLADFKDRALVTEGEAFDATPANIDLRTRRMTLGTLKVALLPKKTRGAQVRVALDLHWGDARTDGLSAAEVERFQAGALQAMAPLQRRLPGNSLARPAGSQQHVCRGRGIRSSGARIDRRANQCGDTATSRFQPACGGQGG